MKRAEAIGPAQPLSLVTREIPAAPPGGCLLKTLYAGVCHSDLHMIKDVYDLGSGTTKIYSDMMRAGGKSYSIV